MPLDRPLVVYTNHPSWWDPALFIVLHSALFAGRAGFGPMDEAALERYGFMRRIGIFGIEPAGRRGAAQFLKASSKILAQPATMLWVTAQGAFTDARVRPVRLQPGVAHLMQREPRLIAIPLAVEYCFWDERFPEALCRFGPPLADGMAEGAGGWQQFLEERLADSMDTLADDAIARDPDRFQTVLGGRVGIGGVYDVWRRLRASVRGEVFDPAHGRGER
ncbi:MAG: lysophospholipid acyltransferase family protein [Geminicoccaceae bacterium]|nr:lysophospholipid acyltransferase family protein [Geminicoccaceae bacterium]